MAVFYTSGDVGAMLVWSCNPKAARLHKSYALTVIRRLVTPA
jgi:hypothetical protein